MSVAEREKQLLDEKLEPLNVRFWAHLEGTAMTSLKNLLRGDREWVRELCAYVRVCACVHRNDQFQKPAQRR